MSVTRVFRSRYDGEAVGEVDDDGTVWSTPAFAPRTEVGKVDADGWVYLAKSRGVATAIASSSGEIARSSRSHDLAAIVDLRSGTVSRVGGGELGWVELPAVLDDEAVRRAGGAVALLLVFGGSADGAEPGSAGGYTSSLIGLGAGLLLDLVAARVEQSRVDRRAAEAERLSDIAVAVQSGFLAALRAQAHAVRAAARFLQPALAGSEAGSFAESTACLWLDLALVRGVAAESTAVDESAGVAAHDAAGSAFAAAAEELRGLTANLRGTWGQAERDRAELLGRAFDLAAQSDGLTRLVGLSVTRVAHEQAQVELPGLIEAGAWVVEAGSLLNGTRARSEWLAMLEVLHGMRLRLRWTGLRLSSFLGPLAEADHTEIEEAARSTTDTCAQAAHSALRLEAEVVRWIAAMNEKLDSQMPGDTVTPELAALDRYVAEA